VFEDFVRTWALHGATLLDALAALIVVLAALRAVATASLATLRAGVASVSPGRRKFSEWLALALEVLIGSDIVRTAVSPDWTEIAQLSAIVLLRVIINYTLLQDVKASE